MVELEPLSESEYLVGMLLVGHDNSKLKESATIKRLLQRWEWWEKAGSQKLSLILKLPAIINKFNKFTSVFLRYFRAVWEESE